MSRQRDARDADSRESECDLLLAVHTQLQRVQCPDLFSEGSHLPLEKGAAGTRRLSAKETVVCRARAQLAGHAEPRRLSRLKNGNPPLQRRKSVERRWPGILRR